MVPQLQSWHGKYKYRLMQIDTNAHTNWSNRGARCAEAKMELLRQTNDIPHYKGAQGKSRFRKRHLPEQEHQLSCGALQAEGG